MPRRSVLFKKLWAADRGFAVVLILLVVSALLLNFGRRLEREEEFIFSVLISLFVLAGALSFAGTGAVIGRIIAVLAAAAIACRWVLLFYDEYAARLMHSLSMLGFMGALSVYVGIKVFDNQPVTRAKLEGAVLLYVLAATVWGQLYTAFEQFAPGSFQFQIVPQSPLLLRKALTYFSFTTMTTVGFGDITPLNPLLRSIVMLEACTGVLYPAILISRLVSLELMQRHSGGEERNVG